MKPLPKTIYRIRSLEQKYRDIATLQKKVDEGRMDICQRLMEELKLDLGQVRQTPQEDTDTEWGSSPGAEIVIDTASFKLGTRYLLKLSGRVINKNRIPGKRVANIFFVVEP